MTKKRLISLFSSLILIFSIAESAYAAGTAGSANDPLISKSYVDNTYPGLVLTDSLNTLADAMTVLKYKLTQVSQSQSSKANTVLAMPGGTVSLSTGSGFVLVFGSLRLASGSGTVVDLTDGSELKVGQALSATHRYIAAENTAISASVITASKLAVFGSVTVNTGIAIKFTDVPEAEWYYSDVCYAVSKGLVNGRSETAYAPNDNLSIAEAIKLAACMHQLYNNGSVSLKNYSDPAKWYLTYVDYAATNGIVAKTYKDYNAFITRSEFVTIFYAALPDTQYTQINTVSDNKIPDVKLTAGNATQIYAFYRAGILTGSDAIGTFNPSTNIKRSEVAAILTRMFEKDARKSITLS